MNKKRIVSMLLALAMVLGITPLSGMTTTAQAAAAGATLTVDMDPAENTGEIIHGAAGFLYGVSSEDVPTTNTIVPLKSKILVTKGVLGTEHPYGDALDVAKTFLESGGEQVQMYNSNYYGVFGVTATPEQYCSDLINYICPAIVAWKEAWKAEHGTPEYPIDNIGAQIDIDEAIVYVPINEGTPAGNDFAQSWKMYREAILSVDENARFAGPNSGSYDYQYTPGQNNRTFLQFCADNNCMPDVLSWHEMETIDLQDIGPHMDEIRSIWYNEIDWSTYNALTDTDGIPELPQVCINEYAPMADCGIPGKLINWIGRLEDEKITGALPFWHQANNLNDLTASANEGNGAWWLFQWYGNMSGNTQPVTTSTAYDEMYGLSTMDEAKKLSTTLVGGWTGDITVQLDNIDRTETFAGESCVDVIVEESLFTGFHGAAMESPTILTGTYPVNEDGSVTVTIPNTLKESAYKVTVTQSSADSASLPVLYRSSGDVYEAEDAALSGTASASAADSWPFYYMSGDGVRAANMPTGGVMTYTIDVPVDGCYRLDFIYGNGQGSMRNDMNSHNTVNAVQTFALDGGQPQRVIMESTLFETMTGAKTLYYDLEAGTHTITVTTTNEVQIDSGKLYHDFVRVSYAAAYGEDVVYNHVYEAEMADFSKLLGNTDSTVTTETTLSGFSGNGYVQGLDARTVEEGGGIRYTVVVEDSGLYNMTLRYQSETAGTANIYVGNTAVTLDRVNKTVDLAATTGWQTVTASIYLQKGINVVDLDTTVDAAVDYLRVRELAAQDSSTTIEAESATLSDGVTTAASEGASGGAYVVGMAGSYDAENREYLEFTYNAPSEGTYQMQVFHSNEDLAGSHGYNIKAVDKYATVEVNDYTDSPVFEIVQPSEDYTVYYFVDCGDHNPATVSAGDSFGIHNSVTDQLYGADTQTGYSWGVVMDEANGEVATPGVGGQVSNVEGDDAVYTSYQKAFSNWNTSMSDGQAKTATFRYAHGQDALSSRYVTYGFELEPGVYEVTVCMGTLADWLNNSKNPTVTLSAAGVEDVSAQYSVPDNGTQVQTMTIDLTEAETNSAGRVELTVEATSNDPTIQMNYIRIDSPEEEPTRPTVTLPGGVEVYEDTLPDDVYVGELADNDYTFVDYRNMKNETTRYFFINTFSDDTFREKTIPLNLNAGTNTIRIYNDNSWQVTYGGTTGTPGLEELPNYTPNFDKFVITPMALSQPVAQTEQYVVDVWYNEGGVAWADQTYVDGNGAYTLSIESEGEAPVVYVNGIQQTAITDNGDGSYGVTVDHVTEDQYVEVYFMLDIAEVQALYDTLSAIDPAEYTPASYGAFQAVLEEAAAVLNGTPTAADLQRVYNELSNATALLVPVVKGLTYFVDCGDHNPATLSGDDQFGTNNSVTDQIYGEDAKTGYSWGVVPLDAGDAVLTSEEGCKTEWNANDKGVYTTYQRPLSNNVGDLNDGQDKTATFRYADGQDTAGYNPRKVQYQFELEPGQYAVTVGMSNTWGNANNPTVTLSADGVDSVAQAYNVGVANTHVLSMDLTEAQQNAEGNVELLVAATSNDPTIQMTYIQIVRNDLEPDDSSYASAGIYAGTEKGSFDFKLKDAKNVAAVQMTFETSSSDVTITGVNDFQYLNVDTVALADGTFQKTVVLSYLPEGERGAAFACTGEETIATITVGGTNPSVTIQKVQVAGYNADGNAHFGEDVTLNPDFAGTSGYDVNGDGRVDVRDITTAQWYYRATSSDGDWVEASICDFDHNGAVELNDLVAILLNFTNPL